jgi:RNA polymerase sigma-70 factor (ECF subfamily)
MNTSEYNECVRLYSDPLFRFIVKNLRDEHESENIVQNTFEKLWVRVDQIDYKMVKPYLFKVAYNNMIDLIRKNKKIASMSDVVEENYSHSEQYNDIKEIVDSAVEKLNEKQKTVILLRDYEGYDYKSIGEITGMTESQVKINIFRARKFLKEYIGKMEVVL